MDGQNFLTLFLCGATGVALVEGLFKLIEKLIDKKKTSIEDVAKELKDFKEEVNKVLKTLDKQDEKNSEVQKQTLYFLIHNRCCDAIKEGYISSEDLEPLEKAWDTYHNQLKGNGFLDGMMKKVREL